jgi:hypothetical protein
MSFFKSGGLKGETGPVWGLVSVGGEDIRKGCRRVNKAEIVCTHVLKLKNEPC